MAKTLIGYARCSTDKQDLGAQQKALAELGVSPDRVYTDHGLTGTHRSRPGLDQALAAVRRGDTLVVPKLDRLARSVPDARDIADSLVARGVKLAIGASVYDPADPMGKMFFNILATFAELHYPLISYRNALTEVFGRYSEFRNIPSCRFLPMADADKASSAELLNSEYSCQPTWPPL
jgi:DNA invertase Pin-like site-specific DNA recombinase